MTGVSGNIRAIQAKLVTFGPCKLHWALGYPRQSLECGLDFCRARADRRGAGFSPQALHLGNGPHKLDAKFVRGVCGKVAFGLEGGLRPLSNLFRGTATGGVSDGRPRPRTGDRSRASHASRRSPKRRSGSRLALDGDGDGQQRQGHHHQQRQPQPHLYLAGDRRAVVKRLGDGDPDRSLKRVVGIKPVGCGLAEAGPVIGWKHRKIRRVCCSSTRPPASRTA